jgi:hypothetical protein
MNIGVIKARLDLIDHVKKDPEKAHIMEDDLYHDFIKFISGYPLSPEHIKDLAKEVLKSKKIEFDR